MQKELDDYLPELPVDDPLIHRHEHHNITDTSREAYHDIISHPYEINGRHLNILHALYEIGQPSTDYEIAQYMNKKDPNYVRPRRYELEGLDTRFSEYAGENQLVKRYPKRKCKITGKTANSYYLTHKGLKVIQQ